MRLEMVKSVVADGIITDSGFKTPIGRCDFREGMAVWTDDRFVFGHQPIRSFMPKVITPSEGNSWLLLSDSVAHIISYVGGTVQVEAVQSAVPAPEQNLQQRSFSYSADYKFVYADLFPFEPMFINWNNEKTKNVILDGNQSASNTVLSAASDSVSLFLLDYYENWSPYGWDEKNSVCKKTIYKNDDSVLVDSFSSDIPTQVYNSIVTEAKTECGANGWSNAIDFDLFFPQNNRFIFNLGTTCFRYERDIYNRSYTAKEIDIRCIVSDGKIMYRSKNIIELYQAVSFEETGQISFKQQMNSFELNLSHSINDSYIDCTQIGNTQIEIGQSIDNHVIPLLILPTTDGSDLFWLFGTLYLVRNGNIENQWDIGNIYNTSVPSKAMEAEKLKKMIMPQS